LSSSRVTFTIIKTPSGRFLLFVEFQTQGPRKATNFSLAPALTLISVTWLSVFLVLLFSIRCRSGARGESGIIIVVVGEEEDDVCCCVWEQEILLRRASVIASGRQENPLRLFFFADSVLCPLSPRSAPLRISSHGTSCKHPLSPIDFYFLDVELM